MESILNTLNRRILLAGATLLLVAGAAACGPKAQSEGRSSIERADDYALGEPDAPVTLIEYASLTCPHCATFHATVFEEIKSRYIETGKVRFVFRQFPTAPARLAVGGEAIARCKGGEANYYAVLDVLFAKQRFWVASANPGQALRDLSATVGISPDQFDACIADQDNVTRIQEVALHAQDTWGIAATPSFIINGDLAKNMGTIEDFAAIIDPIVAAAAGGDE